MSPRRSLSRGLNLATQIFSNLHPSSGLRVQLADLCLQDRLKDEDKFEIAVHAGLIIWSDFFITQASREINNLNN